MPKSHPGHPPPLSSPSPPPPAPLSQERLQSFAWMAGCEASAQRNLLRRTASQSSLFFSVVSELSPHPRVFFGGWGGLQMKLWPLDVHVERRRRVKPQGRQEKGLLRPSEVRAKPFAIRLAIPAARLNRLRGGESVGGHVRG